MDFIVGQLLNGLVYGTLLFLMSAGLSLIFGLMGIVNLAHGSFFMLGAFLAISVVKATGSFWSALILAPIPVVLAAIVIETILLRPLYSRGRLDQVLLTFGVSFIATDIVQWIWGATLLNLSEPEMLENSVEFIGIIFPLYRLALFGFGIIIALSLWLFLERTRAGAMVRAGVDDAATAMGIGLNVPLLFTSTFAAGAALAALTGVIAAPVLGVYSGIDVDILIPAFIVIVIGGMGSLKGALIGSLILGEADTFGKAYFPILSMFIVYLAMIVILLLTPAGLFGSRSAEESVAEAGRVIRDPARSVIRANIQPFGWLHRIFGRLRMGWESTALLLLFLLPAGITSYGTGLVTEVLIYAIAAMSLDLLMGYTGLVSFGHAAFFGLGAYATVLLNVHLGINAWITAGIGILLATASAYVIGIFCVRMKGAAFLMLTLAFAQLIYSISVKWRDVTGGSDGLGGLVKPSVLGWSTSHTITMYFVVLAGFVLAFLMLKRVIESPLGHGFVGIRENELRMRAIGYATQRFKLLSFTIAGGIGGVAGSLYALYNGFVSPETLAWSTSGTLLLMVVLGGTGSLVGPVFGAAVFLLMKNIVSSHSEHWLLLVGLIFISCVMFFRQGIYGIVNQHLRGIRTS
jgi:branched-chain amino acid transport system permease protein